MLGRRFGLGLALVFALGGGLAPVVARAAEEPTEKTFLAGLEKARALLASGKAADGLKLVQDLLKTHERKDYVVGKRADLEDLAKRLSFGVRCPMPTPQDVVKGKIPWYTGSTGRIALVCEPFRHDFEHQDDFYVSPARFTGGYT